MTTAVLVMAYGTPPDKASILEFYTDVRRGRPPTADQLSDLVSRYDAIGGLSPMNERTTAQINALQHALDTLEPGEFVTYYGAKHASPKIEDAVQRAVADGCEALVGLVLAPHYSAFSVGEYVERARVCANELGLMSAFVESWSVEPALIDTLSTRVSDAIASLSPDQQAGVTVVMTAHSLPERILTSSDRYPDEVAETARRIAQRLDLTSWQTAWQSAGRTSEPWLGPDINDTIKALAASGSTAVVVCACGFTSDHLEVLYDLDVLAKSVAEAAGIGFARTASINAEPAVFKALAARVVTARKSLIER
jgi:ferrochelatase